MQTIFSENRAFFISFLIYLLLAGSLLLFMEQGDTIFFFSNNRTWLGDQAFIYITKMGEEIAYIIAILVLVLNRYRQALLIPILGLVVTIVSYFTKRFFAEDRPVAYFEKLELFDQINVVEGVILHSGATSFPSGHTVSGFALFSFLAFCLPQKKSLGVLLFIMAFLVGISRIYLVQHFLRDVYLGSIIGLLLGLLFYVVEKWLFERRPEGVLSGAIPKRTTSKVASQK